MTTNIENLGPAERIIQTLLTHSDHAVHNRPGAVFTDARHNVGVRWEPVTTKVEDGTTKVFKLVKQGKKTQRVLLGALQEDGSILNGATKVAEFRPAGLFPEVVAWVYGQIAEVWKLDNEFAARWASYAFKQEHRDLKTILAAFMLVQSRKGDPVKENGEVLFHDDDFRDVGEAMFLIYGKGHSGLNPKLLLRVHDILSLPQVAQINRDLGFGVSTRKPFYGRWGKAVHKWLAYREDNLPLLEGLVRAGFKGTVKELSRRSGYKPQSPKFFEVLRWKQAQAKEGHRSLALNENWQLTETWEGQTEEQICQRIIGTKPSWKVITGRLPTSVGVTRAIMAAAIEAGSLSEKDLIIQSPTLEELGLLEVQDIRQRWEAALKNAEDQRAANIASRMKGKEAQEKLQDAADTAVKKAVEEVTRGLRIYFQVDVSGSMQGAIEEAKGYLETFLQGFPQDRIHVSVFNTFGREITIKHASKAGVQQAFSGIRAGGGTDYGQGLVALQQYKPAADEDVLFFYIGDEGAPAFDHTIRQLGFNPVALAIVSVVATGWGHGAAVRNTAANLGIPCLEIDKNTFADPYAIPRTIRNLIASTPVGHRPATAVRRFSLVEEISKTELLKKPVWASAA